MQYIFTCYVRHSYVRLRTKLPLRMQGWRFCKNQASGHIGHSVFKLLADLAHLRKSAVEDLLKMATHDVLELLTVCIQMISGTV